MSNIVGTADGGGYWLIGSDGGVLPSGDAGFIGSLPCINVHVSNVVGGGPHGPLSSEQFPSSP